MTDQFLGDVRIFRDLNQDELRAVSRLLSTMTVEKGETVFAEGDPGFDLYIVESGLFEASVRTEDDTEFTVARFRPGDFFGEMAIFEDAPRSATCRSRERSSVLALSKASFFRLVESRPSTAIKIMDAMLRVITNRLQTTSSLVSDMVQWGESARRRVSMDAATGFFNRRFLDEALPGLFSRAVTLGQPLTLVMVDLDNFRDINDTHGHSAGDAVIEAIAPALSAAYDYDGAVLARYGGDEFTFALPETPLDRALDSAERARVGVSEREIDLPTGLTIGVTISQGVAEYPTHSSSLQDLIAAADRALYIAKERGRNRAATPKSEPAR
jgi:diguanylate cyclase (GGDEF)-like protein